MTVAKVIFTHTYTRRSENVNKIHAYTKKCWIVGYLVTMNLISIFHFFYFLISFFLTTMYINFFTGICLQHICDPSLLFLKREDENREHRKKN